ncbi:hypothetical protein WA026_014037 [Henosepilachna vigintioctopunctata]|uniref:Out at first C-terminal domain-containing protein n=1 Tax=Henosepilachna vigintioctopunctata TaxID=420089 RepID=A0AAW1U8S3_9CUCU
MVSYIVLSIKSNEWIVFCLANFLRKNFSIPIATYLAALKKFPRNKHKSLNDISETSTSNNTTNCTGLKNMWQPCNCHLEICIGWYPCSLKYCKGKGQTKNSVVSYRCGIKTCKKCHLYTYYVDQKQQCLWDE